MGKRGPQGGRRTRVGEILGIGVFVAVAALVLYLIGVGCPIKFMTGISCPGCGMTRAWLELARGHLAAAFAYHPLFWAVPLVVALACAPVSRAQRAALGLCIAAFVALWAWRMAVPADTALIVDAGTVEDVVNVGLPGWAGLLS